MGRPRCSTASRPATGAPQPERRRARRAGRASSRAATSAASPSPRASGWVANQQSRWGSCTPADGTIRISDPGPGHAGLGARLRAAARAGAPARARPRPDFWALVGRLPAHRAGPRLPRGGRRDCGSRRGPRRRRRGARGRWRRCAGGRVSRVAAAPRPPAGRSRRRSPPGSASTGHHATSSDSSLTASRPRRRPPRRTGRRGARAPPNAGATSRAGRARRVRASRSSSAMPRLLTGLPGGRGQDAHVLGLEVAAELEPHAGLAVQGEQHAVEGLVEHDGPRGEVGRRALLPHRVLVGVEVGEQLGAQLVLLAARRRPRGEH